MMPKTRDLVLLAIGAPPAPGGEMDEFLKQLTAAVLEETDEMDLWQAWSSRSYLDVQKYYSEEDS